MPELASRQHLKAITPVVRESLSARRPSALEAMDFFAVTQGPGLIGSLLVGLSFAKGLASYHNKPVLGIDHVQAHIESAFLGRPDLPFPVLALVVSGGHTSLFLMKKKLQYRVVGRTRDDAAGEALDKIAKFLDLGYPGGPVIQKLAENGDPTRFPFALPRMSDRSLDFSFSGLKTAAIRHVGKTDLTGNRPPFPTFWRASRSPSFGRCSGMSSGRRKPSVPARSSFAAASPETFACGPPSKRRPSNMDFPSLFRRPSFAPTTRP